MSAAPAMAAAMRASLRVIRGEPWRRAKLASQMMRFRRTALRAGVPLLESYTPIQPVLLGDNARALAASAALQELGLTLSALHGERDIDALVAALARVCHGTARVEA